MRRLVSAFAIVVLLATFGVTLWGGFLAGPQRIVPFLLLVGHLFLPARISLEFPGLPDLDRLTVITLPALVLFAFAPRENWQRIRFVFPDLFVLAYITWTTISVAVNQETWAALSMLLAQTCTIAVPYFAGRLYMQRARDFVALARAAVPVVIVYLGLMAFEARFYPRFQGWVYGEQAFGLHRFGLYRPVVFAENALELGHTMALLAILFIAVRATGDEARQRAGRGLDLGIAAAIGGTLLSMSRGPAIGLAMGILSPRVLRRTGLLAAAIGLGGIGFFLWLMLAPIGTATMVGYELAGSGGESAQTVFFRFQQLDAYRPLIDQAPLFGHGESWDRAGVSIGIIDGALLLTILGFGFPGVLLLAGLWLSSVWYLGHATLPRDTLQRQLGVRLAPAIGWLIFAGWGDAFIRAPHYLLIGGLLGVLAVRRSADEEIPDPNPVRKWRYGYG